MESKAGLLFIYGTLKIPEIRFSITGKKVNAFPDKLTGFSMGHIYLDGVGYPIIYETKNAADIVEGEVIEVSGADLEKLDGYEGGEYRRIIVKTGGQRIAWVYCK